MSSKISQLTSATAAAGSDLHVLARGNSNRKITTALLFEETVTRAAFLQLQAESKLIAGRWYKVTGVGEDNNLTVHVQATAVNVWHQETILETTWGNVWATFGVNLDEPPISVTDAGGNTILAWQSTIPMLPLNQGNIQGNWLQFAGTTLSNADACDSILHSRFGPGTYDLMLANVQECNVERSYISNDGVTPVLLVNVDLLDSTLAVSGEAQVDISDSRIATATLNCQGETIIENCVFENVTVTFLNQARVRNLRIYGLPNGDTQTTYVIDGDFNTLALDDWAGTVLAHPQFGSSTVRMKLTADDTTADGTYNPTDGNVYLPYGSPVGVFLLNNTGDYTDENIPLTLVNFPSYYPWHPVRFGWYDNLNHNKAVFQMLNSLGDVGNNSELVTYHGRTNKVGELLELADWVEFRATYNSAIGGLGWCCVYGCHYD
jgi:hypothetical protein